MFTAYVVVSALLTAYLAFSVTADFTRYHRVLTAMAKADVPQSWLPATRRCPRYRLPHATLMRALPPTAGTSSVRVDRFQRAGPVQPVQPDPSARRSGLVRLPEHHPRAFDRVAPAPLANQQRRLSARSADQREVLADLPRRLLLALESGAAAAASASAPLGLRRAPAHVAGELRAAVGLPDIVGGSPAAHAGLRRGDLLVHTGRTTGPPSADTSDPGNVELSDASDIALYSPTALLDAITAAHASGMRRLQVIRGTVRRRVEVPPTGGPALAARTGRSDTATTTHPPRRGPPRACARPPVLWRLPEGTSVLAPMTRLGRRA
jgi:hypothetical protein